MLKYLYILVFSFAMLHCSTEKYLEKLVPNDISVYTQQYISKIIDGDIEYCYNQLTSDIKNPEAKNSIIKLNSYLQDKTLINKLVLSYRRSWTAGSKKADITYHQIQYEYEYKSDFIIYSIVIKDDNKVKSINGFRINISKVSLSKANEFDFNNKKAIHYFFFLMTIMQPLIILITIVGILKSNFTKKWLWIVFSFIGILSFNLNWSTGDLSYQLFSIKIFSASFLKSNLYGPWIMSFGIPIGSVIFWLKYFRVRKIDIDNSEM